VIKKGFPNNNFKVATETKTETGVKFITESSVNQKNEILAAIKPEFEIDKNWKFKGELNTNHLAKLQVIVSDIAVEGAQVDVSLSHVHDTAKGVTTDIDGKGIYKQERFAVSVGGNFQIEKKIPKYKAQAVIHYPDHVYWSGTGEYSSTTNEEDETQVNLTVDGKISYIQPEYEALLNVLYKKKENTITNSASWYHELPQNKINYGVVFSSKIDSGTYKNQETSINVVGETKCSAGFVAKGKLSTTIKPKNDPTIRSAISLTQKVSPGFSFTVGADFNCRKLIGQETSDAHEFGFEIKLND